MTILTTFLAVGRHVDKGHHWVTSSKVTKQLNVYLFFQAYESLEQPMTCIGVLTTSNIRVTILVIFLIWIFHDFLWSSLYLQAFGKQTPMRLLLMILGAQIILGCLNVALSFKLKLRHMLLTNTLVAGVLASGITFLDRTNVCCVIFALASLSSIN